MKTKRLLTYIKDRLPLLLLLVCVISCAVASAVYAKYVKDIDANVSMDITGVGDIEIEVVKQSNGTYTIQHGDDSRIPAYIRFAIVVNWKHKTNGTLWYINPSDLSYTVPNATQLSDGYYYGVKDGNAQIAVGTVLSGIMVTTESTPPSDEYELNVQILAEAIQCVPEDAVEIAWDAAFIDGNWKKLP
ncbi:MAG: hypothetical protein E7625_07605 [Ruminococcaceae bacterium]|nr:hypothetical protein [Oscillospiraceae bacterium]